MKIEQAPFYEGEELQSRAQRVARKLADNIDAFRATNPGTPANHFRYVTAQKEKYDLAMKFLREAGYTETVRHMTPEEYAREQEAAKE